MLRMNLKADVSKKTHNNFADKLVVIAKKQMDI